MNSIRPIITITILAAVAWFLYLKINQGGATPRAGAERRNANARADDSAAGNVAVCPCEIANFGHALRRRRRFAASRRRQRQQPEPQRNHQADIRREQPSDACVAGAPYSVGIRQRQRHEDDCEFVSGALRRRSCPAQCQQAAARSGAAPAAVNLASDDAGNVPAVGPINSGAATEPPTTTPPAPAAAATTSPTSSTSTTATSTDGERDMASQSAMDAMGLTSQVGDMLPATENSPPTAQPLAVDRYGMPAGNSSATVATSTAATTAPRHPPPAPQPRPPASRSPRPGRPFRRPSTAGSWPKHTRFFHPGSAIPR